MTPEELEYLEAKRRLEQATEKLESSGGVTRRGSAPDEALTDEEMAAFMPDDIDSAKYRVNAQYMKDYKWRNPSDS